MADTAQLERFATTEALFDRYHIGWETKDPEMIASLHSADTVFQLHDGSGPVVGRDALREHCRLECRIIRPGGKPRDPRQILRRALEVLRDL